MNLKNFVFFTFIGAGIWNVCLAVIGYYLYEIREEIYPYLGYIMLALGIGFTGYLIVKAKKNNKKNNFI
jgi:membrane protein DedA with SNARE-associated domain